MNQPNRGWKQMLAAMLAAGQDAEDDGTRVLERLAMRAGLRADPPRSAPYVKLLRESAREKKTARGRGRGLTIILPRGGGYDPMARPPKTPVLPSGASESQKTRDPKPDAVPGPAEPADDGLGVGDDRLELMTEDTMPCDDCEGSGRRVIGNAWRGKCRRCNGTGCVPRQV